MMIICATEVSFLGSIEEFLEMRITFYDATTPGGVEAFIICYACISTNTLGYTNKYVLFVCWLVVAVAFIESAHTRRGFWITLCGCLWQHTHSHSQLPLLPHLSSLSSHSSSLLFSTCPLRLRQGIFSRRRLCELRLRQKLLCPVPKKLHVARTISQ